jgi:hypothetical protein
LKPIHFGKKRKTTICGFLIAHGSCFPGSHGPFPLAYISLDFLFYLLWVSTGHSRFRAACILFGLLILLHTRASLFVFDQCYYLQKNWRYAPKMQAYLNTQQQKYNKKQ